MRYEDIMELKDGLNEIIRNSLDAEEQYQIIMGNLGYRRPPPSKDEN